MPQADSAAIALQQTTYNSQPARVALGENEAVGFPLMGWWDSHLWAGGIPAYNSQPARVALGENEATGWWDSHLWVGGIPTYG